jgi:MHS family proline/betaine transporter-like MFS transporter
MKESPLFEKINAAGTLSKNPIKESFVNKENLKLVLIALFGVTAGQGVVCYTSQFYALSFIQNTCHVEFTQSYVVIAVALVLGTPLFVFFGNLSDSIGRKYIMMTGMALAVICYTPIYEHMYELTDISKKKALAEPPKVEYARQPTTTVRFDDGTVMSLVMDSNGVESREVTLSNSGFWMMVFLVFIQLVFVTMVYGPIAAFLVELFPTRIRYTSMSLPYHIGNGVFGGLTPFIATSLYEVSKSESDPSGNPFIGLLYPMAIAIVSVVVGSIFLSNKLKGDIDS